ncbi:hypothetical protein VNO78_10923 [Psophocarpus tetragonolobus]|uniref:Uncharacterized protein n=1 Tax=Psophocarpus tetragonolobus TaxID=3891 RepID=A0AAN9SKJ3_PSOTE
MHVVCPFSRTSFALQTVFPLYLYSNSWIDVFVDDHFMVVVVHIGRFAFVRSQGLLVANILRTIILFKNDFGVVT